MATSRLRSKRSVTFSGYDPQTSHNTPLYDLRFHVYIRVLRYLGVERINTIIQSYTEYNEKKIKKYKNT